MRGKVPTVGTIHSFSLRTGSYVSPTLQQTRRQAVYIINSSKNSSVMSGRVASVASRRVALSHRLTSIIVACRDRSARAKIIRSGALRSFIAVCDRAGDTPRSFACDRVEDDTKHHNRGAVEAVPQRLRRREHEPEGVPPAPRRGKRARSGAGERRAPCLGHARLCAWLVVLTVVRSARWQLKQLPYA
jgi:hypothetical protein